MVSIPGTRIALLSVGDELLAGEVVDTNAPWIASRLFGEGFRVKEKRSVGDDGEGIARALAALARENDAVVVTGGLGPTEDDVTAAAAALATGDTLVQNPQAMAHLARFGERLGRALLKENERQTLLPKRATLLDNPLGTACGFVITLEGCDLYFLPGVPFEMERMFLESVLPALKERFGARGPIPRKSFKLFGLPEAEAGALLKGVALPAGVELAYCVRFPEVEIILRAPAGEEAGLNLGTAAIRELIGEYLVAEDGETIDSVLASLFRSSGTTLALAESCTGGMIAARITAVAGSSAYFLEGAVTYSNQAKSRMLEVPPELIETHGAVSAEVACAMALGARRASGSDLALAVTGIAGPDGGTPEKPVGTVYLALADDASVRALRYLFPWDRERVRLLTTYTALDLLRRRLLAP